VQDEAERNERGETRQGYIGGARERHLPALKDRHWDEGVEGEGSGVLSWGVVRLKLIIQPTCPVVVVGVRSPERPNWRPVSNVK